MKKPLLTTQQLDILANYRLAKLKNIAKRNLLCRQKQIKMGFFIFPNSISSQRTQFTHILFKMKAWREFQLKMKISQSKKESLFLTIAHQVSSQEVLIGVKMMLHTRMHRKIVEFQD
jgi:hypothetical protein